MKPPSGSRHARSRRLAGFTLALLLAAAVAASEGAWEDAGTVDDVALQSRPSSSGFAELRGEVAVCTSQAELQSFFADAEGLESWVPFTEESRALEDDGHGPRYYLRTRTPWPFKSRDMIYRLRPRSEGDAMHIELEGLPDALPEQPGAVRMRSAQGRWTLRDQNGRIAVSLRLTVDPGRVPGFFANRRLAATVGGTLANLRARFPC